MFVTVNGVRLFFDVINPGLEIVPGGLETKPVLVCLHGGPGGDHQSMRPTFDRLSNVAQVVYVDQRGGGRSEHGPQSAWTMDQWADDIAGVCDALGADAPILLGQSGGAIFAQHFLTRHPSRARGVVLLNACARMDRDALIANWETIGGPDAAAAARAMYSAPTMEAIGAFFQHCMPHYSRRPPPTGDMAASTNFNFELMNRFFSEGGEAWSYDHRGKLGAVTCPVLVIAGAHDPVTRPDWGREVFEALPAGKAEWLLLDDSSHMVPTDQPGVFFDAVERFVRRL